MSPGKLFATFDLASYSRQPHAEVQQGAQSATGPTPFMSWRWRNLLLIHLRDCHAPVHSSSRPAALPLLNPTANDMVALLEIRSTANILFSTSDDPNNFVASALVLAVAPNGPAGILRPGQSGTLTLTVLSNDTAANDMVPVQVSQIAPGQSVDWAAQQAILQPAGFSTTAWNVVYGNLIATLGATSDSYNAALAHAATYLSAIGETTEQTSNVGRLWSFLISQANASFPAPT